MTPHIQAKKNDIAPVVLMPGDPLRAKYIAEHFLQDVRLVNTLRNMLMYTGRYKKKMISICASGMGQASIGIYAYELFNFYDVQKIIRIGSAGSYQKNLRLFEVVLATSAYSESTSYGLNILGVEEQIFYPSELLNEKIRQAALKVGINLVEGPIHTSDVFYSVIPLQERIAQTQAICVEMEAAMLFAIARKFSRQAACLLTISDNLITNEETSPENREQAFQDMMRLGLELAE
ncbi:purine-nucleoside phosphorylase [Mycoplasma sp. ATU-Cv-703]|uniref:purine-nucleoside phosphorylase n=1 Tax=Mycoplasma sp. ATU-Cv-703 TaxID=2498595 RepID=UPI000FDF25B9